MLKSNTNNLIVPDWPASNKVQAFSTTRTFSNQLLGYSQPPYQAFNLGEHVNDQDLAVQKNRHLVQSLLESNYSIQWLNQIHSDEVITLKESCDGTVLTGDAVITQLKNQPLAILTADCLPILLTDINNSVIGAIHCGWRPLASGIISKTIAKMSCSPEQILAWLGPCIGQSAFEVGNDVYTQFTKLHMENSQFFQPLLTNTDKYLADLHGLATRELTYIGVKTISSLAECTFSSKEKYFSYRRDGVTGRMATVINLI